MGIPVSSSTNVAIAHECDELDLIISVLPQLRTWVGRIIARYERSDSRRQLLHKIFTCTLTLGGHLQHWQEERQVDVFSCEVAELATCIDHILDDDDDDLGSIYAAQAPSHSLGYSNLRSICNTVIAETNPELEHLIKRLSDKHYDHWGELFSTLTKLNDRLQNYQSEDWAPPEEFFADLPNIHTSISQFVSQASTALFCEHSTRLGSDLMLKLETYAEMETTKSRSLCLLLSRSDEIVKWREIYVHNQEEHALQKNWTDTSPCVCDFLEEYAAEPGARIDIGLCHDTLHIFLGEPSFDTPRLPTNYTVDLSSLIASAKQNLTIHTKWSLAMRFTYGLLYLYESSKDKNIWTKKNIVFFGDLEPDPLHPFFKMSASTGNMEHSKSKLLLHRCSESLNLGIMLLELHIEKSIDDYLDDGKETKTTNEAFFRSWKVFKEVEATIESGPYRNAIRSCLRNETFAEVNQDVDKWREIFFRDVIQPLEIEMRRSFKPLMSSTNLDEMLSHPNKPIPTIHETKESCFHNDNGLNIQKRSSVNRENVAKTLESQIPPKSRRAPFPSSITSHVRSQNKVPRQSPLQENMLVADHPRPSDPRPTETLPDFETHGAIVSVKRFGGVQRHISVANSVDTKMFATMLDDQEQMPSQADISKTSRAREYLESLRTFNNMHIPNSTPKAMSPPEYMIRICVIDTGLNMSDSLIKGKKNRVIARKSWVGEDTHDNCGHGTHIGRLILGNTNSTYLLIAKVTNKKEFHESSIANIVEAIEWALHPKQGAHIISLSLGFHEDIPRIQKAIRTAIESPTLIFAAAGNWGLNRQIAFPARQKGVFSINASDGKGFFDSINPDETLDGSYTTLGVSIPSRWDNNDICVTGTSFATPIAAVIAATVLNFARHRMDLSAHQWQLLASYQGMRKIFDLISAGRNKYLTITRLEDRGFRSSEEIGQAIKNALAVG